MESRLIVILYDGFLVTLSGFSPDTGCGDAEGLDLLGGMTPYQYAGLNVSEPESVHL